MATFQQEIGEQTTDIAVLRAHPDNAPMNWAIYQACRISSQPNEAIGLSERHVIEAFGNPREKFLGRTIMDWSEMIEDDSGNQAVFNAWIEDEPDVPVGIARAHIECD